MIFHGERQDVHAALMVVRLGRALVLVAALIAVFFRDRAVVIVVAMAAGFRSMCRRNGMAGLVGEHSQRKTAEHAKSHEPCENAPHWSRHDCQAGNESKRISEPLCALMLFSRVGFLNLFERLPAFRFPVHTPI